MNKLWLTTMKVAIGCVALFAVGVQSRSDAEDPPNSQAAGISAAATVANLPPYNLPPSVAETLTTAAKEAEILILGETHGTQEVPALAASLIPELSKLGYGILALEISRDEVESLTDWATGKSQSVPASFKMPPTDGRENVQLLALIRLALSAEHRWKLICFDQTLFEVTADYVEFQRKSKDKPATATGPAELSDEMIEFWQKRDASMARQLAAQRKQLATNAKVLAICGSMHNRIAIAEPRTDLDRLWPTFAAVFQRDQPDVKLSCVHVQFHSGNFFNSSKVIPFRGKAIEQAEIHEAMKAGYHWRLDLPRGTAATFLTPPTAEK